MSDQTHEYRIAHEWVYGTLKGTEYDLDEITEQLAEHMRRSWSVSAAAQGAGYWQEQTAKLEAENTSLRDKIGRQVDNVRVAARDAHTRMVEQLRHFNGFVSELEASDE